MKRVVLMIGLLVVGAVAGGLGYRMFAVKSADEAAATTKEEPLYWVAPMDSNYRRDKPGKSPMGMDLVPVYASDQTAKGVVQISSAVANNIAVRTGPVRRGRLKESVTTVAYVDYDESMITSVYPRVEGWLRTLYVTSVGEEVQMGDPLYEIYSPMLVNAQEEFLAALKSGNEILIASVEARLAALQVPRNRVESLRQGGKVSESLLISAPRSGIVKELSVREGAHVMPATKVMTIVNLDRLWVSAEVFEQDVGTVEVGDEMRLNIGFDPIEVRRASIDFVYPILESVTRTLKVRASIPNEDGKLKPNMFAEASIDIESDDKSLLVPIEAVIRTGTQDRVVLAMNEGEYKSVAVRLGRASETQVEVIEGLVEGDRVVTSAQFLIDSESSKTSDFKRMNLSVESSDMNHDSMDHGNMNDDMDHESMDHDSMDHDRMEATQ